MYDARNVQTKKTSNKGTVAEADDDDEGERNMIKDSRILAEISRVHHCDRCGKACMIDPGPPPVHRPFSMHELSLWTSLVVRLSLLEAVHIFRLR